MSSGQALTNSIRRAVPGSLPSDRVFRLNTDRTRKVKKEKEKKMGWFKKKFAKWTRDAWEEAQPRDEVYPVSSRSIDASKSIRFTIYPASGGYVIEHYKNDRMRESDGPTLTIVNNGDSIGQAIEHAIAVESLKA